MRGRIYLLLLFVFLFSLTGCDSKKTDNKKGSEESVMNDNIIEDKSNKSLTMEYVCEEFNINEAEFEGVDFDAFVSYYGLTYDNIKEGNPRFLLNDYKSLNDNTKIPEYGSLKATTNKFLPEYMEQLEAVIIQDIKGEICIITIIDYKLGKVISASGNIDNITAGNIVKDADDSIMRAVRDSMDKYDICSWEAGGTDSDGDIVGTEAGYIIFVKMKDNSVYGISCKTGKGNDLENIDGFVADMEKIAAE